MTPTQYGAAVALGVVETLLKAGADPNQHVYSEDNTAVVVLPLVKLLNAYDSLPMLALLLEHGKLRGVSKVTRVILKVSDFLGL